MRDLGSESDIAQIRPNPSAAMTHQATMFMTRRQLQELLHIKSRETIRTRLKTDSAFPRPVARGLWRTRDVMRYAEGLSQVGQPDVSDLL